MRLDIHYHSIHSDCSSLALNQICRRLTREQLPIFTATDHGNVLGCKELELLCVATAIVYGVEVTTREGDFLVYSLDTEYVQSLSVFQDSVSSLRRDADTAVIWAHPRVPHKESIGWTSPSVQNDEIAEVVKNIDGLELFNGNMLKLAVNGMVQRTYFSNLAQIGAHAEITLTGASDAHDPAQFYTAWTEFDDDVKTPEEFIRALKTGQVKPGYDHDFYKINVP